MPPFRLGRHNAILSERSEYQGDAERIQLGTPAAVAACRQADGFIGFSGDAVSDEGQFHIVTAGHYRRHSPVSACDARD